jgi:hypothetical protein
MTPNKNTIKVLSALSKKTEQMVLRAWELSCQSCPGNSIDVLLKTASSLKIKHESFSISVGDKITRGYRVTAITPAEVVTENTAGNQYRYPIVYFLLINIHP